MNAEEIIAERKLIFISPDGNESLSSIQLGKPYSSDEHGYCCDIEIPNIKKRRFASGVDAIQAIQLSIFMLASILDVMKKKVGKYCGQIHDTRLQQEKYLKLTNLQELNKRSNVRYWPKADICI